MVRESAQLDYTRVRNLALDDREEVGSSREVDEARLRIQLESRTSTVGFVSVRSKISSQKFSSRWGDDVVRRVLFALIIV
ncbi:hypothetical protein BHM03_00032203 [Ensete ventricosum]|nr:hypothetical protein BHM03_00032203 [Ensete ventricosum]